MKRFYIYAIPKVNMEVALRKQLVGLPKKVKLLEDINRGDEIIFYQTGEGEFIARGVVSMRQFSQRRLIWPDEKEKREVLYPYRLRVKVKKLKYRVDIDRVLYGLSFIKNKEKYGGYLRSSLLRIPQRDYQKILLASNSSARSFG